MKIGVVTVFKTENCGSFWQAWALQSVLQKMGHEVRFLPYVKLLEGRATVAFQIFKCCVKGRFSTARFLMKRRTSFLKAQKSFQIRGKTEGLDACVFGSDTIWNFADSFFREQSDFFLGAGVTYPKIGYAVSAGSTTAEDFFSMEGAASAAAAFSAISVRDSNMADILNSVGLRDTATVLDPTMLLSEEQYPVCSDVSLPERYVFVYYFGRMSDEIYSQLSEFCREKGLEAVHMGFPDKRFPRNVANAPADFIQCYRNAEYVFTNTFHGCIFSVLFNKVFATDGMEKKKIADLIERFDLSSQCVSDGRSLAACFAWRIDYGSVNGKLSRYREESLAFLEGALLAVEAEKNGDRA